MRRRMMLVAMVVLGGPVALVPRAASAENLFDFLFGGQQNNSNPRHRRKPASLPIRSASTSSPHHHDRWRRPAPDPHSACAAARASIFHCWRAAVRRRCRCARRFVRQARPRCSSAASIDGASSSTGERYADSENTFAYRKALRADCACNGRDPARPCAGGSYPRHLAASRRHHRHHQRPRRLFRHPGRRQPGPRNSRRSLPIPASPRTSAQGWAR